MNEIACNIFVPRNDWNVRTLNCKKAVYKNGHHKAIAEIIEKEVGVSPFEYMQYRGGRYVKARQLFIVMMVNYSFWTYENIGNLLGKDHSTINNSLTKVENYRETDRRYRAMYNRIDEEVKKLLNVEQDERE